MNERIKEPGKKWDAGKLRFDLLPTDALKGLVEIFTFGANKYGDRNWEKGMAWSRPFAACQRHLWAFWSGEIIDPESGLHHLSHAAWNALILDAYFRRKLGNDDREVK